MNTIFSNKGRPHALKQLLAFGAIAALLFEVMIGTVIFRENLYAQVGEEPTASSTSLTVTKIVQGGPKKVKDFPLFVDGMSIQTRVATTTLSAGVHVVSEIGDPDYTAKFMGDCNSLGEVTLVTGEDSVCKIINTYTGTSTGTTTPPDDVDQSERMGELLRVCKEGPDGTYDFTLSGGMTREFSLDDGECMDFDKSFEDVLVTVTEVDNPEDNIELDRIVYAQFYGTDNFHGTTSTTTITDQNNVTAEVGGSKGDKQTAGARITFHNILSGTSTATTTSLTVTKVVQGGTKVASDFSLFVDGMAITSGIATTTLGLGAHIITETNDPDYTATFSGGCNATSTIILAEGDQIDCVITNTFTGNGGGGEETFTLSAAKVVCDSETDLPNWSGAAVDISSTTAEDFVEGSNGNCRFEPGWQFEWGPSDAANPGGSFVGVAGAPWTTLGLTNNQGIATTTIHASGTASIAVREVLTDDSLVFASTTDSDVSAEFWCDTDVLNYDNIEIVSDIQAGEVIHCMGINVLDEGEVIGAFCPAGVEEVETEGSIVSDTNTLVGTSSAALLTFIHPAWTADVGTTSAAWIWSTDPVATTSATTTETFTRVFTVNGTSTSSTTGATLNIAADNTYKVWINDQLVADVSADNNFELGTQDSYNVASFLANGTNTLRIEVTNLPTEGGTAADNPAGLRFSLTWTAISCGEPPLSTNDTENGGEVLSATNSSGGGGGGSSRRRGGSDNDDDDDSGAVLGVNTDFGGFLPVNFPGNFSSANPGFPGVVLGSHFVPGLPVTGPAGPIVTPIIWVVVGLLATMGIALIASPNPTSRSQDKLLG